ncbi:conserved hypothetical protein [Microsporum canis CBS 113480]|uniref:Uncharacterized protein n=1 Tax=Arthroderma otae (strain ATCC MYA-4605 / CBS 113480) TaxID=554155 RepID=C5FK26_ARTOC|nr:conserved hypothetical protein [Microsporum canis CBS 113480]EEQ30048.1 conserved hypothetical protein [Microsporum canis CBS 113480]
MNHDYLFTEEERANFSPQEIANLMALCNYMNGIETSAVAASEQEGDSQGQQSAEYKLENQAKAMEADTQGNIEHKDEHPAMDSVAFDFDDLINLTGSPDRMSDADLAPKHQQAQSSYQNAHTSSISEMAHPSTMLPETILGTKDSGSVTSDGCGQLKQSPPDYGMDMVAESMRDHPSPQEPKDPSIPQMAASHPIPQPITNYSGSQTYAAVPLPQHIHINNTVPSGPAPLDGAWSAADTNKNSGRREGTFKGNSPTIEPKDERANLRDSIEPIVLQFSSSKDANGYRPDRRPMPVDPTVPRTVSEQKECVVSLIKAMKSFECATDNWGMIKPFANRKFSDRKIEVCCWNILTRKTVCRHLLDPYYLLQFVDDPSSCLSDGVPHTLASPFATPKHEDGTASSSFPSNSGLKIIPGVEAPHPAQQPVRFHQLSPQASPMISMQSPAAGQSVPGPSVVYPTYPAGNFGATPFIGYHPGHAYNSAQGAAGNIVQTQVGTMVNAPQVNATSPPRSPWNQAYSNTMPSAQYQISPRTPSMRMPSTVSKYPTPPVSSGSTPYCQAKLAHKASRKRSADASDRSESPVKKGRY